MTNQPDPRDAEIERLRAAIEQAIQREIRLLEALSLIGSEPIPESAYAHLKQLREALENGK